MLRDHGWIGLDGRKDYRFRETARRRRILELPQVGRSLKQGEVFGTIESVKAVSELFSPVSGEVIAVNTALAEHPEAVNADPHASWMIALRLANPAEADALPDAAQYAELVK
jgi:glycine cleavage system H protein